MPKRASTACDTDARSRAGGPWHPVTASSTASAAQGARRVGLTSADGVACGTDLYQLAQVAGTRAGFISCIGCSGRPPDEIGVMFRSRSSAGDKKEVEADDKIKKVEESKDER
jgi:hypothetical protein